MLLATFGLAIAWRWWAVAIAPLILGIELIVLRPATEAYDTGMAVILGCPMLAIVAAAAVLAGRWAPAKAAWLPLVCAAILGGAGLYLGLRVVDRHPDNPVQISLSTGRLEGLERFKPTPDLEARFGEGKLGTDAGSLAPLGYKDSDLSGPSSYMGPFKVHRFKKISVFTIGDHVIGFVTADRNVELGRGVGIGDSIALIRKRGLPMSCSGVAPGSDSSRPVYPACEAALPRGGMVFAGGDPIDSIWVMHQ